MEATNRGAGNPNAAAALGTQLLRACDGNFSNGMPDAHHIWYPDLNFHGPECDGDARLRTLPP